MKNHERSRKIRFVDEMKHGEFIEKLNGLDLWYRVSGKGPVCLLPTPGWGVSIQYLEGLQPLEEHFTVIYFETRGTGRSALPESTGEYSWNHFTMDIEALRQHLGQDKLWLLGHSQGGMMVMHYALTYPHWVSGLMIIDSLPGYDEEWVRDSRSRANQLGQGVSWDKALNGFLYSPPMTEAEYQTLEVETAGVGLLYWHNIENAQKYAAAFTATTTAIHPYQGVAHSRLASYDFLSHLHEIKCPALLVVGASDGCASLAQSERLHRNIPNSKLLVIEKAGHFPWLEASEAFFSGVRTFLPFIGYTPE